MKKMIFLFLFFAAYSAQSQITYNLPSKNFYYKATAHLYDSTEYYCKELLVEKDSISFQNIYSQRNEKIALANIEYLKVQHGTSAVKFAIIGGLFFGLNSLANRNSMYRSSVGIKLIVFAVSGAAIGGVIGSLVPRWRYYYLAD